jgi:transcriptional regulator with XRE-family HTH domain
MGLTIFDMTLRSGIREAHLGAIENRRTIAYPKQRQKIAEFFGVPEGELFDERGFAKDTE